MKDAWKRLESTFRDIAVPDLNDGSIVRGYTLERRAQGVGDGTLHTELGYLRAAIGLAKKQGKLTAVPFIALPSKPRPRSRHLTGNEARALLEAAVMPHIRLFILLALYTAGRPSSILDLTWDRVDFDRGIIQLDNPSRDQTAKGRATVPMPEALELELREAKRGAMTHYVIEWARTRVRSVKKGVGLAAKRAGLEGVSPYVLRHTAAVWMAQGGVPITEISQYMGHTTPAVTFKVYARYSPDYLRHAASAIDTVLRGSPDRTRGDKTAENKQ
jgi:integrase